MESESSILSPLAVDKSENDFSLPSMLNGRKSSSPLLDQCIEAVEAESEEEITSEDVENHRQGLDVHLLLGSLFGQRMHFLRENLDAFPRPSADFNATPDPNLSLTIGDHDLLSDSYDLKGKGKERARPPERFPVPNDSFFYLNVFDQMRLSMERNRRLYEEQELEIADFESEDEVPLAVSKRNALHMSAFLPRKPEFIPGPSRITLDEL